VQHGGSEHCERRRIGIIFQLAPLARQAETRFEIDVESVDPLRERIAGQFSSGSAPE
jgi:hypothetical protein